MGASDVPPRRDKICRKTPVEHLRLLVVIAHPTAEWIAQRLADWTEIPRYLIRDRGIYGAAVTYGSNNIGSLAIVLISAAAIPRMSSGFQTSRSNGCSKKQRPRASWSIFLPSIRLQSSGPLRSGIFVAVVLFTPRFDQCVRSFALQALLPRSSASLAAKASSAFRTQCPTRPFPRPRRSSRASCLKDCEAAECGGFHPRCHCPRDGKT